MEDDTQQTITITDNEMFLLVCRLVSNSAIVLSVGPIFPNIDDARAEQHIMNENHKSLCESRGSVSDIEYAIVPVGVRQSVSWGS